MKRPRATRADESSTRRYLAGLRLAVSGGLGAGIPVVSATAGLEIGAELGLEGEASAAVQVSWSPSQGVELEAMGKLSVEPVLRFDVTGFVKVEADVVFDTIELYEKRWQLAAFEFGSGLKFGITFPVHYKEGEPFELSLDDVEFDVPEIDPGSVLEGLVDQIA